jgi:hypothetical protein
MDSLKLKIESRKLVSGRYQVNFSTDALTAGYYGYLLAEPQTSVTEIIEKISRHIHAFNNEERYLQRNLFSLGKRKVNSGRILIFKR